MVAVHSSRAHVARVHRLFLDDAGIDGINWSSHAPKLNPTENLWGILSVHLKQPNSSRETLLDIIHHLMRPLECCVHACGGHKHY